jgi:DNA-binding transcriptional ArsR family regulator
MPIEAFGFFTELAWGRNQTKMANINEIAKIAALVGEPTRAAMLAVLMDDRALTAAELAHEAGITPQTASTHLAQLVSGCLLKVEKQGRQRFHRLATPEVARMLEGIMQIAAARHIEQRRSSPNETALRAARTCYDHIAGHLGVAIAEGLVAQGALELDEEAALLTERGITFLREIGIDLPISDAHSRRSVRPLCRSCLDWTERRPHLGGKVGALICVHSLKKGWVRRIKGTRALETTPRGRLAFRNLLGITV